MSQQLYLKLSSGSRCLSEAGKGGGRRDFLIDAEGVRRSVTFSRCKARRSNDFKIAGIHVREFRWTVEIIEHSPKDDPPWPEAPWRIGKVSVSPFEVTLHVSPSAFRQFWEMADAPENDSSLNVRIDSLEAAGPSFVSQFKLHANARKHPIAAETESWYWAVAIVLVATLGWFAIFR